MLSAFLYNFGEVRPFLYPVAANVAHGLAEPVYRLQGVDGVEDVEQIVGIGHVGTALNPIELMLCQRALYLVVRTVVEVAVVLFEVGDFHVETQCIHRLRWLA